MFRFRAAPPAALLLLLLLLLLPACASRQVERMMERVPRGQSARVFEVRLEEPRRRYMVSEDALARVARLPGVLTVERGSGMEKLLVCLRGDLEPGYLADSFRGEFKVEVLGELATNVVGTEAR